MTKFSSFIATLLMAANLSAAIIDFEDSAAQDEGDASAYLQANGLSITASAGPRRSSAAAAQVTFEAMGADGTDVFAVHTPGLDFSGLGNYLMKVGTGHFPHWGDRYMNLSIDYDAEVTAASGEIWDIDNKEQFSVVGYDANGDEVASVDSPRGGWDGLAWTWSLSANDNQNISSVVIERTRGRIYGVGFDNFDFTLASAGVTTATVPIPAAFPLGCLGLMGVMLGRRKRKKA